MVKMATMLQEYEMPFSTFGKTMTVTTWVGGCENTGATCAMSVKILCSYTHFYALVVAPEAVGDVD